MTLERLMAGIDGLYHSLNSRAVRIGLVAGLGAIVLSGCDDARSVDTYEKIYSKHKVPIVQLMKEPQKYEKRFVRVEGLFAGEADLVKDDYIYAFFLKQVPDSGDNDLLYCVMDNSHYGMDSSNPAGISYSIVQQTKSLNEQGIMKTIELDGILRGDNEKGYRFDVHRIRDFKNRYILSGNVPNTDMGRTSYKEWEAPKAKKEPAKTGKKPEQKKPEQKKKAEPSGAKKKAEVSNDDWATNPANPANPASPISPYNPANQILNDDD